jgi:hypothetical protein
VNKKPEWQDDSKLRKAVYSHGGYSGWVYDLGDGTCRFANDPLLGENGPNWGDRVHLFEPWDCDKEALLPFIGTVVLEKYEQPETQ